MKMTSSLRRDPLGWPRLTWLSSAVLQIIANFCNESMYTRYGASLSGGQLEFLWSAVVSIFLIGGAVGSLGGSWLADRVGRKGALIASGLLAVAAAVLFFFCKMANSVEMLVAGRLLVGLASGLYGRFVSRDVKCFCTEILGGTF